jgi:hypothetical protein
MQSQTHYTDEDRKRLAPSRKALAVLMLDGLWHDPYELAKRLSKPNAGTITSHLRDLKASGVYDYERQREGTLHRYRLTVRTPEQLPLLEL